MSCPFSTTIAVTVTFLLTAIFSSILTLALTLLVVCVYKKRAGLTRKESVEQDVYELVQTPGVFTPVPLNTNVAYGLVGQH